MNFQPKHFGFNRGYKHKKTAYAVIEILEGNVKLGDEGAKGHEYLVSDYSLGRGIEALAEGGSTGLYHIYDGVLDPSDDDHKMPTNQKNIPWVVIHADNIPVKISKNRSVAACAYNATETYMKHWLGMQFDHYDKEWYTMNSLVTEDGLPQANSFTVIQQLVQPYGLGISNIYVPRNNRRFKEYLPFIKSLGANPFFARDGYTTNEEALVKLFPDDEAKREEMREVLFAQWKFECLDACPGGVIAMTQFHDKSVGHNGASTYRGPRAPGKYDNWKMAIKVDLLTNINYLKPVVLPEYEEYEGKKALHFMGIKNPAGKTIEELKKESYKSTPKTHSLTKSSGLVTSSDSDDKKGGGDDEDTSPGFQKDDDSTGGGFGWNLSNYLGLGADRGNPGGLDYPPVCENCQQSPGSRYVAGTKVCQHCESPQEKNYKDPFIS